MYAQNAHINTRMHACHLIAHRTVFIIQIQCTKPTISCQHVCNRVTRRDEPSTSATALTGICIQIFAGKDIVVYEVVVPGGICVDVTFVEIVV